MGPAKFLSFFTLVTFAAALMPLQAYEAEGFLIAFVLLAGSVIYSLFCHCEPAQQAKQSSADSGLLRRPPGLLAMTAIGFAFWALAFISVLFSEVPYTSYIFFCFFSVMPLAFLLTAFVQQKEDFFRAVFYGTGIILAALAAFTLIEYAALPAWLYKGQARWPFADPNSLAALLSLGFFCGFGAMLGAANRISSHLAMIFCLLLLAALLATGSRAALIALAGALAIFVYAAGFHVRKHWRCCGILVAGTGAAFLLLGYFAAVKTAAPATTIAQAADVWAGRGALWASAWNIFKDHFWTGTGIGTFFLYYPAYRVADYKTAGFTAHNDPLQFASEMGVFAPLLFYAFAALAIFKTAQKIRSLPAESAARLHILAPFCALGAMAVHAHVNYPLNILPILMLSGLLLGYWYHAVAGERGWIPGQEPGMTKVKIAGLAILSCASISFIALQASEILVERARGRIEAGDLQEFSDYTNMASRLAEGKNARAYVLASTIPLGILESPEGLLLSTGEQEKLYTQAKGLLDRAQTLNPRLVSVLYNRARLEKAQGHDARAILENALALNPLHTPSRLMLADLLIRRNEKQKALDVLKNGLRWPLRPPEKSYLYQKTAFLALELGDAKTHSELMQQSLSETLQQQTRDNPKAPLRSSPGLE